MRLSNLFEQTSVIDVYHGSNTGADNSVLNSFKTKGAMPMSKGAFGQSGGFYVYLSKKIAADHALMIAGKQDNDDDEAPGLIVTSATDDGLPMVVTVQCDMNSFGKTWKADYEAFCGLISSYLIMAPQLVDAINRIIQPVKLVTHHNSQGLWQEKQKMMAATNPAKPQTVQESVEQYYTIKENQLAIFDEKGMLHIYIKGQSIKNTFRNRLLEIIEKVEKADPSVMSAIMMDLKNYIFKEPNAAIKYVGNQSLPVKSIEVYKDNQWVKVQ